MHKPISKRVITKTAWHWSDVVGDVGLSLLADVGIMGALGSLGVFSGGATGAAGAMAAVLGTTPIGIAIGVALLAGGLGYAIYEGTKMADNSIADVIKRLTALDYEDTPVQGTVAEWHATLLALQESMRIPAFTGDYEKDASTAVAAIENIQKGLIYLKSILRQWPMVKPYLADPFYEYDQEQFVNALQTTIRSYENIIRQLDATSKRSAERAKQVVQDKFQKTRPERLSPLVQLMAEIKSLTSQIANLWSAPVFSKEEQAAIAKGEQVQEKSETELTQEELQSVEALRPQLIAIRNDLRWYLSEINKRQQKRSSRLISKRAVDVKGLQPQKPEQMTGKKRNVPQKMPVVESLQRNLNHLKTSGQVQDAPYLKEDGVYGQSTFVSLIKVLNKFTNIAEYLRINGVPVEKMTPDFANSSEGLRFVNFTSKTLERFVQYSQSRSKQELAPQSDSKNQTQEPRGMGPRCIDKVNPTPQDILNCLQTTYGYVGNRRTNLYDYMRAYQMDDNTIVRLMVDLYGGRSPMTWSPIAIIKAVDSRYGG